MRTKEPPEWFAGVRSGFIDECYHLTPETQMRALAACETDRVSLHGIGPTFGIKTFQPWLEMVTGSRPLPLKILKKFRKWLEAAETRQQQPEGELGK